MAKVKVSEDKISNLIPDNLNANKGSEFGQFLMEESFRKLGAGRSILLDKNNRIIAGNKSIETSAMIGLDDVIIVETTGNQIVAVKRMDVDLDSAKGRELALADNATSKANLVWDYENIEQIKSEWDIQPEDWGINVDNYAAGHQVNSMTDEDVDIEEEFDPVGTSSGQQRVVFLFDGPEEAESYLTNLGVDFKKMNMAWQVNLSTQSIL